MRLVSRRVKMRPREEEESALLRLGGLPFGVQEERRARNHSDASCALSRSCAWNDDDPSDASTMDKAGSHHGEALIAKLVSSQVVVVRDWNGSSF